MLFDQKQVKVGDMADAEFNIFAMDVGKAELALSPMPGRWGDLKSDCVKIQSWGATLVVSMVEKTEFTNDGFSLFTQFLKKHDIAFVQIPVRDFGAIEDDQNWLNARPIIADHLTSHGRVLFHCYGGCGRSGMVALRSLVELGWDAGDAFDELRAIRPCAVETAEQLHWASKGQLSWDKVRG